MTDGEIRELCNRFFDAYEGRRIDELAAIYAPEAIVWHSHDCLYQSRESNLKTLRDGMSNLRKMRYRNRRIHVFEGGFVIRYTLAGVQHDGHRGALWICIVGLCKDGKITRIDEYMDSSKFAAWAGRGRAGRES